MKSDRTAYPFHNSGETMRANTGAYKKAKPVLGIGWAIKWLVVIVGAVLAFTALFHKMHELGMIP